MNQSKSIGLRGLALGAVIASTVGATSTAQSVIFPQQEQPGNATVKADATGNYRLANDLFEATYLSYQGNLTFGGCEKMGLGRSADLFRITLGNGTVVPSSEMTLLSVTSDELTGNADAARGSEKLDGAQITATYSYGDLEILWRAVLRNGSHYLRTEMELTAKSDVAMQAVTPMIYPLAAGADMPKTVGNTRGAILAGEKIFAGVESPMGINTVGKAGAAEAASFTYDRWTPESFDWNPGTETPAGILAMGYNASQIVAARGALEFKESGECTVTFTYAEGTHRLNIVGVDIVAADGSVAASDYHYGYTGNLRENNSYTLSVPAAGLYTVRYFMETRTETITSSGNITYSNAVSVPAAEDKEGETAIEGRWSRNTTLAAGKTWTISSVVGLIAPRQARRSVLAYSERERAVPWRPFPLYNSWYELNIDRNNAAPPTYSGNMTINQCVDVVSQWHKNLYDAHGSNIAAFVWDDGWDEYGTWTFNCNFPNGFKEADDVARDMNTGIGAWLGPVGGYGTSGNYRRQYWNGKGGMQLSNPAYYKVFLDACSNLVNNYDFRFFKFDGISAQFSSVGPDPGTTGDENAEGIIDLEQQVRKIKPDIFLNTTVGTWASPFWFRFTDAVWRQEGDFGTIGNQGTDRERWITYRDRLVYQNFVQNSPLCPINTLMTHGVILTQNGDVAKDMGYDGIVRELRCAFACGSGMVELYCDYKALNNINGGALWADIAECIEWQAKNADVLPDIHWVGGNPWDGSKANVYGWASWNGEKSTLALRNPAASAAQFTFTLREALDIPDYFTGSVVLTPAFAGQAELQGITAGEPVDIDTPVTVNLPRSSVFVFDGIDSDKVSIESVSALPEAPATSGSFDMLGRPVANPTHGLYIIDGQKTLLR